jgi:hypothetical protein
MRRDNQIDVRPVVIGGVIALLLASPWLWGWGLSLAAGWNQATAARQLAPVIAGLEQYHRDQGQYPLVITDLAIQGITLPRPPLGWRYGYTRVGAGRNYYLAMEAGAAGDPCIYYEGATHAWARTPACPPGDTGPLYQRFP